MNLLHLKYASEIARTGSLNKAAENLYVGQPNLSRAIKELEGSLGITIFDRSPKGMVATTEGEEFLRYADKILSQVDEMEALYKIGTPIKRRFSISVPRTDYISEAFINFTKQFGADTPVELIYKETNAMRAVKNILKADYKLGIISFAEGYSDQFYEMLEQKGLDRKIIGKYTCELIMSREHELAGRDCITLGDLGRYTEIAYADTYVPTVPLSAVRKDEMLGDINKRIYVFERLSQLELLNENHDTFMRVPRVPQKTLDRYGLVQKKCAGDTRLYLDVLVYKKDYKLSELDEMFLSEVEKSKKSI